MEKTEDTKTVVQEDTPKRRGKNLQLHQRTTVQQQNVIKAVYATEAGGNKAGTDYSMFQNR